jgi:5-methylcytosine-specific restriction protein A
MRQKPLKICARAGCSKKTKERFCEEHKKHYWSEHDKKRPNSTQRGYDHAWSKFRKSYLERNPLCLHCRQKGFLVSASEVDHIKPLADNPQLKYDNTNLRPLCKRCHSRRTWHEQSLGAKNGTKTNSDHCEASKGYF